MSFMYELGLDPEAVRELAANKPGKETDDEQAGSLPEAVPEMAPPVAEEQSPNRSKDPRYSAAFAMIMYWSQHGGC